MVVVVVEADSGPSGGVALRWAALLLRLKPAAGAEEAVEVEVEVTLALAEARRGARRGTSAPECWLTATKCSCCSGVGVNGITG